MKRDNGGGQNGQQVVLKDSRSTRPGLALWELEEGAGKRGVAGSCPREIGPKVRKKKKPDPGEEGKKKREGSAGGDLGGGIVQLFWAAGGLGCWA